MLLFFLNLTTINGQNCSVHGIDGGTNGFTSPITLGIRFGQTFVACQTGNIESIEIGVNTGNYELYLGTPNGGLLPNLQQTFQVTGPSTIPTVINLNTPFPVIAGNTYEFQFTNPTSLFSFQENMPSDYIDGFATINGVELISFIGGITHDLDFDVVIAPSPIQVQAQVPTMSQWGLFVFGLLVLNVSVFFVQRRELI